MFLDWTLGKKITAGFTATALLTLLVAMFAVYSITSVAKARDQEISQALASLTGAERTALEEAARQDSRRVERHVKWLLAVAGLTAASALALAIFLSRSLRREMGTAILRIRTSSAQLRTAANEQAIGSQEQSTSTNEVASTLKELVVTSRQMAENAAHVTQIAEQTGASAKSGEQTVGRAQEAVEEIRRQVDLIASHMLDLGRKSQQIGSVLDIINELAEQTNILSINATIESAGAGEAGRRFAVVADEIRKLADSVASSTRDVRALIEEIRSSANTTVMVTEDGTKAAAAGSRRFEEVIEALRKISDLVETTTDAAREIELGTKQQVSAVEQVNVALLDVAQSAEETEASTRQTLATSTELATLAENLDRVVRSREELPASV